MDYSTGNGGEKMVSKGNFLDFIEEASTNIPFAQAFKDVINAPNVTAQDLLNFFNTNRYHGVNLEDCTKLLKTVASGPLNLPLPTSAGQY